jgi:nitrate reductase NapE component
MRRSTSTEASWLVSVRLSPIGARWSWRFLARPMRAREVRRHEFVSLLCFVFFLAPVLQLVCCGGVSFWICINQMPSSYSFCCSWCNLPVFLTSWSSRTAPRSLLEF